MRTALSWAVTQRVLVIAIEVSGQAISPIFKGQDSRILDPRPLGTMVQI